ncbi:hypothetical protein M405DRAFT_304177 [Rhizopogon salebrosus TDB-379]|nr:hypothetical protein M405DRAFT_304177 [Rhizopogon salebrosus TDB-379]
MPFMMDIRQLLVSLDVFDIHDLTFPDLMAFVWLACMAKPFIHQCMADIRHPPSRSRRTPSCWCTWSRPADYPCMLGIIPSGYLNSWYSTPN